MSRRAAELHHSTGGRRFGAAGFAGMQEREPPHGNNAQVLPDCSRCKAKGGGDMVPVTSRRLLPHHDERGRASDASQDTTHPPSSLKKYPFRFSASCYQHYPQQAALICSSGREHKRDTSTTHPSTGALTCHHHPQLVRACAPLLAPGDGGAIMQLKIAVVERPVGTNGRAEC